MKKLLFLFALIFVSCSNNEENEKNCDCYVIEARPISCEDGDGNPLTNHIYCLDVRNVCTNEMEFGVSVTQNYWSSDTGLGETVCDLKSNRLN